MRHIFKYLSFLGLAMTVVPACLVFVGQLDLAAHQAWMLAGTGLWFVTAPIWIRKKG